MISSPPEFKLRRPAHEDAGAVHRLGTAVDERFGVDSGFALEDLLDSWRRVDLDRDAWLWERDGAVAAYACLYVRGEETTADGYVHPGFVGRGLGAAIVEATEARALERRAAKLGNGVLAADGAAASLLASRGPPLRRRVDRGACGAAAVAPPRSRPGAPAPLVRQVLRARHAARLAERRHGEPDRRDPPVRAGRNARGVGGDSLRKGSRWR